MSIGIEDIVEILYCKYKLPKSELGKIVRSQFKVARIEINAKGDVEVPLMYIGTFKPTPFRIKQLKKKGDEYSKQI